MGVSLTELRQRLFELADQVVESGLPLEIERRGVRLRLSRIDEPAAKGGRLARLQAQSLVVGAALLPSESPAQWTEMSLPMAAEQAPVYRGRKPASRGRS